MIDLSRIRTLKPLETMRNTLNEFISFDPATMIAIYNEENDWGKEDYEADIEEAKAFLEQVEKRIQSLSNYLNNPNKDRKKKVKGKNEPDQPIDQSSQS